MVFFAHNIDVLAAGSWIGDNWGWIATSVIAFIGLIVIGLADTKRFSLTRAWAISGVCFDESIRKRVLWITPLAIIGVIGITQFQRALDEQDAIRQSVKICLFATGLVVMLTSIILACTNLPKEIESRVIYTILTKPTTRLELIVGKVMGFARVSLTIVLIMGVFSWIYLRISAEQRRQQIAYRLQEGDISDTDRTRLNEYNKSGFLTSRNYWQADELGMYGKAPLPGSNVRVISNEGDQDVLAGFLVNRAVVFGPPQAKLEDWAQEGAGSAGLIIRVMLNTERVGPPDDQPAPTDNNNVMGPVFNKQPATAPAAPAKILPPRIGVQIMDENFNDLFASTTMAGATTASGIAQQIVQYASKSMKIDPQASAMGIRLSEPMPTADSGTAQYAYAWLPPNQALTLFNHPRFFVRLSGMSGAVNYMIDAKPVSCFVPQIKPGEINVEPPAATEIDPFHGVGDTPEMLTFRGRLGLHLDQEMNGGSDAPNEVADFAFLSTPQPELVDGQIPFQLNLEVDRSNSDVQSGHEDPTKIDVTVIDTATKKVTVLSQPIFVESRLPTFFSVPADAITSSNYQILLHCENSSLTIGLVPGSLMLVASHQLFEWNLMKSLSIIWMMSILVVAIAIFCSTFLSWPIAIVLTVLLLLGHWGVDQVADSSGPGLGRQIVNDFKFTDAAISKVVSTGVDTLTHTLNLISNVLPDTSRFDAIEDVEQGVSVSSDKLLAALAVMAGFGVPAIVLSYVILLGKEVAP